MIWLPIVRLDVVKLAVVAPPLLLSVPFPMLMPLSKKITVPVGLATVVLSGPLVISVAVKATICPDTDGAPEETTAVVVLAMPTLSVRVPVLAR